MAPGWRGGAGRDVGEGSAILPGGTAGALGMELDRMHLSALLLTTEADLRRARAGLDGSEEARLRYAAAQARALAARSVAEELLLADPRAGRA